MKPLFFAFWAIATLSLTAQQLTGSEVLEKSIDFHDPNGSWASFSGSFNVTMEIPDSSPRKTKVKINLPTEYFYSEAIKDSEVTTFISDKGNCIITPADSLRIANQKEKPRRTHCETTVLYKNYYTYLYGLPMKLKDPGTNIDPTVARKTFKGKEYLVVKAFYDEGVGSDVWFFYFDPTTYAMEVYQFFKGDPKGEGKNTGEYILLSELEVVEGIKMPKTRAWYYNKDDKYLGTDILSK